MNRRHLLKLLASGLVAKTLDVDKLLWVPGQKTIFIPPSKLSLAQITALEYERIVPKIKMLLERNDMFYKFVRQGIDVEAKREMRIPLTITPGKLR